MEGTSMKPILKFSPEGRFRILMVSDIQEPPCPDPRALRCYRALVDHTRPDLIIWGGDNCDGRKLKTEPELREYLEVFTAPAEEAGIPWMHIFGNHDYDVDLPAKRQHELYTAYPHNISGTSPDGVPGVSNYMVPVYRDDGRAGYAVYAFDTMYKNPVIEGVPGEKILLPELAPPARKWDFLRFDQLMWYWNTSLRLEKENGGRVRAAAVMHVPLYEFIRAVGNPEETGLRGDADQKIQSGMLNSGCFAAMLQRGDIECIAAGHLHEDTFDAEYAGITLCFDGCAGFTPSSKPGRRGGRVFDITADGGFSTEFIKYSDITDID